MLYQTYETGRRLTAPVFGLAGVQRAALELLPGPVKQLPQIRAARAWAGTLSALELTHQHPGYGIDTVETIARDVYRSRAGATPR